MSSNNILVTGFGPFGSHRTNASWECVRLLPSKIEDYTVITEQIEVAYNKVDESVVQLWARYNPKLVIHVGVSDYANNLTLETRAYKEGYGKCDIYGKLPPNNNCSASCQEECIKADLNVEDICALINSKNPDVPITCTSLDAGRYLCEYTFYTSLSIDNARTLFIHVPKLNEPFSAEELCAGLMEVIKAALIQLA